MNTKIFLFFAIFLAAAGIVYYSVQVYKTGSETPASGLRIGENAVYVNDQRPGNSVTIGVANIEHTGYVVIHESANEKPGAIIGKSVLLNSGEIINFNVPLSRLSRNGEELVAVLHSDNGDGTFNPALDQPVKDAERNTVFMIFPVSEEAEESGGMINF